MAIEQSLIPSSDLLAGHQTNALRDYRPNVPGNVVKNGYYPIDDLKALSRIEFKPKIQEIIDEQNSSFAGYLSEMPVGGTAVIGGKETYFVGVLPFFLLISPVLFLDKGGQLASTTAVLRSKIANIMQDQEIKYIPRQAQMPLRSLHRIKRTLTRP